MKVLQAWPDPLVLLYALCDGTEDHLHYLPTWILEYSVLITVSFIALLGNNFLMLFKVRTEERLTYLFIFFGYLSLHA